MKFSYQRINLPTYQFHLATLFPAI
jgi:hypothetical protein